MLQLLQQSVSEYHTNMDALSSLSHSMAETCSPEDSLLLGEGLAQLVSGFESLQRGALGRRRLLEDGLDQATSFSQAWSEAMGDIGRKQSEVDQFEVVGVDIDTVKAQLDEYKVPIIIMFMCTVNSL